MTWDRDRHLLEAAERAISRGHTESAIVALRRVLAQNPESVEAHALLSLTLLKNKRTQAARHEAEIAVGLDAEHPLPHELLGRIAILERRFKEAHQHLETARALAPESVEPLRGLSALAQVRGQRDEALRHLETARALDPEDVGVLVDLGHLALSRGDAAEAQAIASEVRELSPDDTGALLLMGEVLLRRGDVGAARDHAVWVLEVAPQDDGALRLLGNVKARQSLLMGSWFRLSTWLMTMGTGRSTMVLVGAYVVFQFASQAAKDLEAPGLAGVLRMIWLGICLYSFVAPALYRRMVEKELGTVRFKSDF